MLILGSHVSFGNQQILGSVKEALGYNANTFMFYTGAPTNTIRKEIDSKLQLDAKELMKSNGIDIRNVICHAPYIVNPATSDESKREFAINFLKEEIRRCSLLDVTKIVLHPGSAVGISKEEGLKNIVNVLNNILNHDYDVKVLIETMAGKGSECGTSIDEVAFLMNNVNDNSKLGVCIDTCHINDAGYDLNDFDNYLDEFDNKIGINKIGCIHVNDSKNPLGSHKDRHENIGFGTIGFEALINVIYNDRLNNVPKILETPYVDKEYAPYKYEIKMIKEKKFNVNLIEDIKNNV